MDYEILLYLDVRRIMLSQFHWLKVLTFGQDLGFAKKMRYGISVFWPEFDTIFFHFHFFTKFLGLTFVHIYFSSIF